MNTKQKILIIQTSFLGDVILSLPMVQSLKKLIPQSEIDYLCIPSTANVLQNNSYIRNVIIYDKKASNKISKIKEIISHVRIEKYDIVVCPHRSFRSALITYKSRANIRIGFDKNSLSFLLTHKAAYRKDKHEIERNLDLIRAIPEIGIDNNKLALKPELFPGEDDKNFVSDLLKNFKSTNENKLISFAPCSKWFTKKIPFDLAIEIINSLINSIYKVALIGGHDDEEYCSHIENKIDNAKCFVNLCGKLTPVQSAFAIQQSSALITADSAAAHLGASTGIPIVMIYGSTIPSFGFYPLTSKNIIIENNTLYCRPCTNHGRASCPKKHFKCMNALNTNEIIEAVNSLSNPI